MSRVKLEVITELNNQIVTQIVRYKHRYWFDRQLVLNQLRKIIESVVILPLEVISRTYEKNKFIVCYKYDNISDVHVHDGRYYFKYVRKTKTCRNCVGWNPTRRYCDWKEEVLIKEIVGCDGFLEKITDDCQKT